MITGAGEYRVDFFNKYKQFIPGISLQARSLGQAVDAANCRLLVPVMYEHSYLVMRCIVDSEDKD
jgi:hypothetical protein